MRADEERLVVRVVGEVPDECVKGALAPDRELDLDRAVGRLDVARRGDREPVGECRAAASAVLGPDGLGTAPVPVLVVERDLLEAGASPAILEA